MYLHRLAKVLVPVVASACLWTSNAQQRSAASVAPEYRSVDPAKDGFTVQLKSQSMTFDEHGWMSGDSVTIEAIGTASPFVGATIVLLGSGKCLKGIAKTKDFGIIKVKSAGGFSAKVLMTQNSINEVHAALRSSMSPPKKAISASPDSTFRLRVGTDIQFPRPGEDVSNTLVVDEGKASFVSNQNIAILLEIGSGFAGKTAILKVKDLTDGTVDETEPIPVKISSPGGGMSQTFNLHLPAKHPKKIRISLELGALKREALIQIAPPTQ